LSIARKPVKRGTEKYEKTRTTEHKTIKRPEAFSSLKLWDKAFLGVLSSVCCIKHKVSKFRRKMLPASSQQEK